jgi:hypothetical protein
MGLLNSAGREQLRFYPPPARGTFGAVSGGLPMRVISRSPFSFLLYQCATPVVQSFLLLALSAKAMLMLQRSSAGFSMDSTRAWVGLILLAVSCGTIFVVWKRWRTVSKVDFFHEVIDAGDALIVCKGSQKARIPLSDILNMALPSQSKWRSVTLALRTPCRFGGELSFLPMHGVRSLADLMVRIEQAHNPISANPVHTPSETCP